MRFLSIILLACIVFLSSFGEAAKPVRAQMMDCCKKADKPTCDHVSGQQQKKATDDCNDKGCTMLFSCQLCGFIVKEAIELNLTPARILPKPVTPVILVNVTGYHEDNWKPPQTC